MKMRALILGSAHYMKEWVVKNKARFSDYLINSLYHVLNSWNGELLEICLAGCDLVYPTEKSHFYEKGTADPLRLGQEYLIQELVAFKNTAERAGVRVLNVGGQEESLLPFERAIF